MVENNNEYSLFPMQENICTTKKDKQKNIDGVIGKQILFCRKRQKHNKGKITTRAIVNKPPFERNSN